MAMARADVDEMDSDWGTGGGVGERKCGPVLGEGRV